MNILECRIRGHLYTALPGAVQLIEEVNENVPKRQRSSGELWVEDQAPERHRADHVLYYFKELAREVGQTPCERTNLWQAAALLATRHNIPVHVVPAGRSLEKHGGVAALLAREEPWTGGGSYGHSQSHRGHLAV